jgi:tetratricopeptide (TPR) repeat protein
VAALDDWAWVLRIYPNVRNQDWRRLLDVADRCDGEPLRRQLRQAVRQGPGGMRSELERLAARPGLRKETPTTIVLLANALVESGSRKEGIRLLENAVLLHTGNFWINLQLAEHLASDRRNKADARKAEHWFKQSIASDPLFWEAYVDFGCFCAHAGRLDEAIQLSMKGRELSDKANEADSVSRYNLAELLLAKKQPAEAKRYWDEAEAIKRASSKDRHEFAIQLVQTWEHVLSATDLATVRENLERLPDEERDDWRKLWGEVDVRLGAQG